MRLQKSLLSMLTCIQITCLSLGFGLASAAQLKIHITATHLLANPNTLPSNTHATLTSSSGQTQTALIRKDNSILFSDVETTGTHLLKIYTRDFIFAPYRIDTINAVGGTGSGQVEIAGAYETYPGTQWSDHGVALIPESTPGVSSFTLHPKVLARKNFYEDRAGFNPLSLLKNPMILMGGVALLFTFGMPKLMDNMDPEFKAEYAEMQKKGPASMMAAAFSGDTSSGGSGASGGGGSREPGTGSRNAAGFDLAGFLAGSQSKNAASKSSGREGGAADLRQRR